MNTDFGPARVGTNFKRLIKESDYRTQEAFAAAHGADPRTVRRWIHDGIDSLTTIGDIARTLDVDVMALLF